jgi:hypothetical protein
MESIIEDYLAEVSLGTPVSYGSMTVVPVFAPPVAGEHEYLLMQEAMDLGVLTITELHEAGSVPQLMAVNTGKKAILLIDGEQLVGAKQDRVLNTTVMLAPDSKTVIPVSCTEHGRWWYSSREFRSTDYVMSSSSRRRKMRSVMDSLKRKDSFEGDQRGVWDEVEHLNRSSGARSPTGAMKDSFAEKNHDVEVLVNAFPIQLHQRGILVFVCDGVYIGFEMVSEESVFTMIYKKILRSYTIDAVLTPPSHRKVDFAGRAKVFLGDIRNCNTEIYPAVAMGTEYRFAGIDMVGSGLIVDNVPIHLSFHKQDTATHQPSSQQMAGFRERRSHAVRRNAEV